MPSGRASAASATLASCVEIAALHSAAASTTSDFTACRAEPAGSASSTRAFGVPDRGRAVAASPSPVPRDTHASRTGSRGGHGPSVERPLARLQQPLPTPRTGQRRARRRPADQRVGARLGVAIRRSASARPSHARAAVVPAELAKKRRPRAVCQRRQRPAALSRAGAASSAIGAAIAALAAGRDGAQPPLVAASTRGGSGQRPGSSPNAAFDQQCSSDRDAINTSRKTGTGGHASAHRVESDFG